ncbi:hypothetical protein NQZ68_013005 [Dissostichus eleginoides]|nr:hypothetical protein NQZ68_013005 [Dissostichus eleginoides]
MRDRQRRDVNKCGAGRKPGMERQAAQAGNGEEGEESSYSSLPEKHSCPSCLGAMPRLESSRGVRVGRAFCPVHFERFSKLVPPGTTVLKIHTVADGLRSVEAVMTQFRHDRLRRTASNNYRADSLNHRLMKTTCALARSLQETETHLFREISHMDK